MTLFESERDGFITQAASGVAESLYSAGVACSVQERREDVEVNAVDGRERE